MLKFVPALLETVNIAACRDADRRRRRRVLSLLSTRNVAQLGG
jgi:hypothetical protein